jgi:hypothetical protein
MHSGAKAPNVQGAERGTLSGWLGGTGPRQPPHVAEHDHARTSRRSRRACVSARAHRAPARRPAPRAGTRPRRAGPRPRPAGTRAARRARRARPPAAAVAASRARAPAPAARGPAAPRRGAGPARQTGLAMSDAPAARGAARSSRGAAPARQSSLCLQYGGSPATCAGWAVRSRPPAAAATSGAGSSQPRCTRPAKAACVRAGSSVPCASLYWSVLRHVRVDTRKFRRRH